MLVREPTHSRGESLHAEVPPDRWCVTRADVKFLRSEVWRAMKSGLIQPSSDDVIDHTKYGPSIYTVNDQYIKPVTQRAGNMSWALMQNPSGLDCHLFISHAWREGIFEFISMVRYSWPYHLHHAWCCFLAMPQNLDIRPMLQHPNLSPFALALVASSQVLVVPNHSCSIYTRLWCTYEAFLAHDLGKVILIATQSSRPYYRRAARFMLAAVMVGFLLGMFAKCWGFGLQDEVILLGILVGICSAISDQNLHRIILNCIGEASAWYCFVNWYAHSIWLPLHGFPAGVSLILQRCVILCFASVFCLLEVDRIRSITLHLQSEQLSNGYEGSICHATCTEPRDAAGIKAEVGEKTEEVDFAIEVLLKAGMSTPALREVARAGVDVAGIQHPELTVPFVFLVPINMTCLTSAVLELFFLHEEARYFYIVVQMISILCRLLLLILAWRRSPDERSFILKMITKCVPAMLLLRFMIRFPCKLAFMHHSGGHLTLAELTMLREFVLIPAASFVVMLGLAWLGIRGLAMLPGGLCLLQFFLARGCKVFGGLAQPVLDHPSTETECEGSTDGESSTA
mmetsp:Transcript_56644/g.132363  ORF Transcript_56644/g.132363 Transcript_56644/m.132363 type:complete len:569 (-) Transcript_56644:12-1718(-)